jgi:hypothetical protein
MIVASLGAVAVARQRAARGYWGSPAADQAGSRNLVGMKNSGRRRADRARHFREEPRDELLAATKALDRVLLWEPTSYRNGPYGRVRTARWDRFGRPNELPKYGAAAFPTSLVVGRPEGHKGRDTPMKYSASDLTSPGNAGAGRRRARVDGRAAGFRQRRA